MYIVSASAGQQISCMKAVQAQEDRVVLSRRVQLAGLQTIGLNEGVGGKNHGARAGVARRQPATNASWTEAHRQGDHRKAELSLQRNSCIDLKHTHKHPAKPMRQHSTRQSRILDPKWTRCAAPHTDTRLNALPAAFRGLKPPMVLRQKGQAGHCPFSSIPHSALAQSRHTACVHVARLQSVACRKQISHSSSSEGSCGHSLLTRLHYEDHISAKQGRAAKMLGSFWYHWLQ